MSSDWSVSEWICDLRSDSDSDAAAQKLWERYFEKLVKLARRNLQHTSRRISDEEDVALSAFKSLCLGVERNRFPQLKDRQNLWKLLITITVRKARDQARYAGARKRDNGRVESHPEIAQIVGDEPTPEFAAQVSEQTQRILDWAPSPKEKQVLVWMLEGFTDAEIADKLGCARVTVWRTRNRIRARLEQETLS